MQIESRMNLEVSAGATSGEEMGVTRDGERGDGARAAAADPADAGAALRAAREEISALQRRQAARDALYAAGALDVGACEISLQRAMGEHPDFPKATTPEAWRALANASASALRARRPGLFSAPRPGGSAAATRRRLGGVMGAGAATAASSADAVLHERAGAGERGSLLMFLRGRRGR